MPRRLYLPLALLAVLSLLGDLVCRSLATGGDQKRLLQSAHQCISQLPATIGPWRAKEGEPLSTDVLRMLDCRAHASRIYVDDQTGEQVGFLLLAGSAGPLLAHTAEVCYGSGAFDVVEAPGSETIRGTGDRADVFHQVTFGSKTVTGHKQRVYYAWRKFDGPWQAPADPRWTLGGQPMLYKLQLACDALPASGAGSDPDAVHRFLTDLLPVLDKILAAN